MAGAQVSHPPEEGAHPDPISYTPALYKVGLQNYSLDESTNVQKEQTHYWLLLESVKAIRQVQGS